MAAVAAALGAEEGSGAGKTKAKAQGKRQLFGPEAMGRAVIAIRGGASFAAAARAAGGFCASVISNARKRSPAFDAAVADALKAGDVPRLVFRRGGDGKGWQVRRGRRHVFDAARKNLFLTHFSATLDAVGAAEAAGVCHSTAYEHRRTDPAFAAAWAEAARIGVERLSEEAGRQRLAAMAAIQVVPGDPVVPEAGAEFERTMTFLKVWGSRVGPGGSGGSGGGGGGKIGGPPLTKWTIDAAMDELERNLIKFGAIAPGEADAAERGDREDKADVGAGDDAGA
jgi:hypothetical protein